MITGEISFQIKAQYNNGFRMIKKNPSKMASSKVEICLKKKNPPRAQIFRYFRIESRNKKLALGWTYRYLSTFNLLTFAMNARIKDMKQSETNIEDITATAITDASEN